jgi:hypothetical protein
MEKDEVVVGAAAGAAPGGGDAGVPFFFRPKIAESDSKHVRFETYRESRGMYEIALSLSPVYLSYTVTTLATKAVTPTRSLPVNTFLAASASPAGLLRLAYYPLDRKTLRRQRCTLDFQMNSPEHAASWAASINGMLAGVYSPVARLPRRHVLVLVNPFGGTKKAPQIWREVVEPMWREAGLTYEVVETQYSGHAKELARRLDLTKYDALTTISGDGLFWELLSGLLMRPDWREAVKVRRDGKSEQF